MKASGEAVDSFKQS